MVLSETENRNEKVEARRRWMGKRVKSKREVIRASEIQSLWGWDIRRALSYIFYASFIYFVSSFSFFLYIFFLFPFSLNRGMEILILRNTVAGLRWSRGGPSRRRSANICICICVCVYMVWARDYLWDNYSRRERRLIEGVGNTPGFKNVCAIVYFIYTWNTLSF